MALICDLEDLVDFDPELSDNVIENTLRYQSIFADVIEELLPDYKEREVNIATPYG